MEQIKARRNGAYPDFKIPLISIPNTSHQNEFKSDKHAKLAQPFIEAYIQMSVAKNP